MAHAGALEPQHPRGGGDGPIFGAIVQLLAGLLAVLISAWLFTNALEWFGLRARVSPAALGSVFAAVGTALPEATIAVLAAVGPAAAPAGVGDAVSIGAVLGAPLLLATLGFTVLGVGGLRAGRSALRVPRAGLRRDLIFFLCTFGAACLLGAGAAPAAVRLPLGATLVVAYAVFIRRTLAQAPQTDGAAGAAPGRLLFGALGGRGRDRGRPSWWAIAAQLGVALAVMFAGAELFVHTLTGVAAALGLSGFVLAALVAPLATELPETVNSLVWLGQGKDALAAGNVTGAMVLQGAVIPAVGMWFTPWAFDQPEAVAAGVALLGALVVLVGFVRRGRLSPWLLVSTGILYVGFLAWAL